VSHRRPPSRHHALRRAGRPAPCRLEAPGRADFRWLPRSLRAAGLVVCCAAIGGACDGAAAPSPSTAGTQAAAATVKNKGGPEFEAARAHAVQLQESGADQGQVLQALQAAYRLNPDHYGINHRLAQACSELKLHDQALDHFLRAYRARPEDHETLLASVTLQVRLGQLDEALANLPPLQADPAYAGEARYQHATILDQRGERAAALALVADTSGLAPPQAYRCKSLHGRYLLEDGDFAGAEAHFRAALAGRADYKEALKGMADSSRRLGQDSQAAHWDEVLDLVVALTDNIYVKSPREREGRRATLERLVACYPEWTDGFAQLADLQLQLGDKAAACATIETFLARQGATMPPEAAARLRDRYCGGAAK